MAQVDRSWNADRIGAYASFACAIHCLITSVALGLLSVVGLGFFGSPAVDVLFIVFAVSVGAFAVWSGYRKHNSLLPAILFLTGLSMVVVSHFILGHSHLGAPAQARDWVDMGSDALAVVGGLTLVAFHFVNARKIKHAGCQCPTCRTERVSE